MSEKPKVKCAGCEARAQKLRETSIRVWRKAQTVVKWKRKR